MSLTKERNEVLFERYVAILRQYGRAATGLKKSFIYEQVAEPLFVEPKYVGRLICHMLKDKERRKVFEDDEELKYILSELEKISGRGRAI